MNRISMSYNEARDCARGDSDFGNYETYLDTEGATLAEDLRIREATRDELIARGIGEPRTNEYGVIHGIDFTDTDTDDISDDLPEPGWYFLDGYPQEPNPDDLGISDADQGL